MADNDQIELHDRVKKMIVRAVKLKISPERIENKQPLFGAGGLKLDSLDALELVIALEKEFGVRIPNSTVGRKVLVSVDTMVQFILEDKNGKSQH
jgi:acyl carrier protein